MVADGRSLPFPNESFDTVFSYSVLQHFSKENVHRTLREIRRVLRVSGEAVIQMPNKFGIRSIYHQLRRIGQTERGIFHVRYWSPSELLATFERIVGPAKLSIDGFFGLGVSNPAISRFCRNICSSSLDVGTATDGGIESSASAERRRQFVCDMQENFRISMTFVPKSRIRRSSNPQAFPCTRTWHLESAWDSRLGNSREIVSAEEMRLMRPTTLTSPQRKRPSQSPAR